MRQETSFERFKRRIKTKRYRAWLGKRILFFTLATAVVAVLIAVPVVGIRKGSVSASAQVTETPSAPVCPVEVVTTVREASFEPVAEVVPEVEVETVSAYDVPLDLELQLFIVRLCEEHHIDASVVMAMIDRESKFDADVIGDSGEAFGLMQVQPKWHRERMNKLGVTDLLDPYQNVTVGVDYLAEMLGRDRGLEWALAAYNAGATGANKGYGATYANAVLTNSEILKEGMIEHVLQ